MCFYARQDFLLLNIWLFVFVFKSLWYNDLVHSFRDNHELHGGIWCCLSLNTWNKSLCVKSGSVESPWFQPENTVGILCSEHDDCVLVVHKLFHGVINAVGDLWKKPPKCAIDYSDLWQSLAAFPKKHWRWAMGLNCSHWSVNSYFPRTPGTTTGLPSNLLVRDDCFYLGSGKWNRNGARKDRFCYVSESLSLCAKKLSRSTVISGV